MGPAAVTLSAIGGIPIIEPGDDIAALLIAGLNHNGITLQDNDVLVVAQKIISKAEGRFVDLRAVEPSPQARDYADRAGKDPRVVELILAESTEVLRCVPGVIIVAHRLGHVAANAGIDQSNVQKADGKEPVLLLPVDPDDSASRLKQALDRHFGVRVAVIINDSVGRAWRLGTVGMALGVAGLPALVDKVNQPDLFGRKLESTQIGFADELAAAASLVMGQAAEGQPAVLLRGVIWDQTSSSSRALLRPVNADLFR
ncbi:coenzyme F420-0:L-glutamate ligase [Limibacillus sp. MBR-115]|jgi:coenzyme F420-0:L-glutamate ligase/coenzyme F420-1:gamma-L-glutamate ligase|uniref:coenzyme F420-0:L-glutamate ligase n=1 Tax=Limibacillus sp. MBR-115 TaxID=3156465 RepID=UPI00339ADDA7